MNPNTTQSTYLSITITFLLPFYRFTSTNSDASHTHHGRLLPMQIEQHMGLEWTFEVIHTQFETEINEAGRSALAIPCVESIVTNPEACVEQKV